METKKTTNIHKRSKLIWTFLTGSKKYFCTAIIAALIMQLLSLISPKIIRYTIDTVIDGQPSSLPVWVNNSIEKMGGITYLRSHFWIIGLAVVVIAMFTCLSNFIYRYSNNTGAETLVKTMRDMLYNHIAKLPFSWFSENHTGDIIQRCTSDVDMIKTFVSEQLTSLVRTVLIISLSLYYMYQIHVVLALTITVFIPIIIGYSIYFHKHIGQAFQKADEEEGKLSAIAQENLTGVRVVRAFNQEGFEKKRFEKQNVFYTNHWIKTMRLMMVYWMSGDFMTGLQVTTAVCLGAYYAVKGQITAGSFIAFLSYNQLMLWPIRSVGRVIARMSQAGISLDRLAYIMDSKVECDEEGSVDMPQSGDIVFDHVSFKYPNSSQGTLKDISFTIPSGTTCGIIGATGSGKSTLMYLLDKLQDLPKENGKITINGVDIRHIKRESIRKQIGMVLQEPYLFSRSLSQNINIASPSSSMDDIEEVSRIASLDEAIHKFQKGYDTPVGERGVTLSGGQKQRTAIAQMLIRKPSIMVFDDSLSAVDAETDIKIREALKDNTNNATVILIAHRITTLMDADKILVIDDGKIAEQGTHQELLSKNGLYKQIYDLQVKEEV